MAGAWILICQFWCCHAIYILLTETQTLQLYSVNLCKFPLWLGYFPLQFHQYNVKITLNSPMQSAFSSHHRVFLVTLLQTLLVLETFIYALFPHITETSRTSALNFLKLSYQKTEISSNHRKKKFRYLFKIIYLFNYFWSVKKKNFPNL